jgi:hypothetical protein
MHIAILTCEGFNELDSLIAFGILNRVKRPDWRVSIACRTTRVRSMNGLAIESQAHGVTPMRPTPSSWAAAY